MDESIQEIFINPLEQISYVLKANGYGSNLRVGHIEYDKNINNSYEYQIIRSRSHDGTMLFTEMTIREALTPLITKTSYYKKTLSEDDIEKVKDIKYIIGDIKLVTEFGEVELKIGKRFGQTDIVYIPVKCEYEFK